MQEPLRKAGALALGTGALSLVLVNAFLTHGCGGTRPAAAVETPGRSGESRTATPPAPAASNQAATPPTDPDCTPPPYMYATKAPIWLPAKCPVR